jgi:hypothetical protein
MDRRADLHRRRSVATALSVVKSLSKGNSSLPKRLRGFILSAMAPATPTTKRVFGIAAARKRIR